MRLVPWIASLLRSPPALVGVLGFRDEIDFAAEDA
jgi:hypothetical protein